MSHIVCHFVNKKTPGWWQSIRLLTMDECESKITINSVFDYHLSQCRQQTAIQNSVSNDFRSTFVNSINVFDCGLSSVRKGIASGVAF